MVCTSWVKKFLLTLNAVALCEAGNHVVLAVGWEADRSVLNLSLLPPSEAVSVVVSVEVGQAVSVTAEEGSGADVEVLVEAEEGMPPTEGTVVVVVAALEATEEAEAVSVVTALRLAGIVAAAAAAADMDQIVEVVVSEVGSTADHMAAVVVSEAEAASEGATTQEDPGKTHQLLAILILIYLRGGRGSGIGYGGSGGFNDAPSNGFGPPQGGPGGFGGPPGRGGFRGDLKREGPGGFDDRDAKRPRY